MAGFKNYYVAQTTAKLTSAGSSVTIGTDLYRGAALSFTNERIAFKDNRGRIEFMKASASAGTLTISARGLDQSNSDVEVSGLKLDRPRGSTFFVTQLAVQMVDKTQDNILSGDNTFSGDTTFSGEVTLGKGAQATVYATTAARDSALGGDGVPAVAYVGILAGGVFYNYNTSTGQRENVDTGTATPAATTTTIGTLEAGTVTDQQNLTTTGESGGIVVPKISDMVISSSGSGDAYKIALLSSTGKLADGFVRDQSLLSVEYGENITVSDQAVVGYIDGDGKVYISDKDTAVDNKFMCLINTTGTSGQTKDVILPYGKFAYNGIPGNIYYMGTAGAIKAGGIAIDFDGSTEYLQTAADTSIGIVNAWTIVFRVRPTTLANSDFVFTIKPTGSNVSKIDFQWATGIVGKVQLSDSGGTAQKVYSTSVTFTDGTLYCVALTWDGTNLKIYKNATEDTTPTKTTDNALTMVGTSRSISYGAETGGTNHTACKLGTFAIWSTAFDATNITAVYKSGEGHSMDLSVDSGNYDQSASLVRRYKVGASRNSLGKDFASSDHMSGGANIAVADITQMIDVSGLTKVGTQVSATEMQVAIGI